MRLLLALFALLALPAVALADDGPTGAVVHEHKMSPQQVQQVSEALFAEQGEAPVGRPGMSNTTWCGTATTSDLNSQPNNGPHFKVIYAYAKGEPNNFANYANLMQRASVEVNTLLSNASGGALAARWDVGSDCGTAYLDIQTLELPRTLAEYNGNLGNLMFADLRAAFNITNSYAAGNRIYLVWADRLGLVPGAPGGQGEILQDTRAGDVNYHNLGNRVSILYGRGQSNFFYDSWGANYPYTVALHEMGHNLGAVQLDTPNNSGGWHCNDGLDIMCYADGGSRSTYSSSVCSSELFDCGGNDYFNMSPSGGSYLSTRWNLRDSNFFCPPTHCETATAAPVFSSLGTSHTRAASGQTVTLTANFTDDGPTSLRYRWNLDGLAGYELDSGTSNTATFTMPAGSRSVTVKAIDGAGLTASGSRSIALNAAPTAAISGAPGGTVTSSQTVALSSSSSDSDGSIASYSWRVNGSEVSTGSSLSRTYSEGSNTVQLTVTDNNGASASTSVSVVVANPTVGPSAAAITSANTVKVATSLALTGSATVGDSPIASYAWDFGDGSTGSGSSVSHSWAQTGSYTVQLTVTDTEGRTSSTSKNVTVTAMAGPSAVSIGSASSTKTSTSLMITASAQAGDSPALSYSWNFGDGTTASGSSTTSHSWTAAGNYTVTLTVTDANGLSDSAQKVISVTALVGPQASVSGDSTVKINRSLTLTGAATAGDGAVSSYAWNFGDGTSATGSSVAKTWTVAGSYPVSLTVTDSNGLTATAQKTVIVRANRSPNAKLVQLTASPRAGSPVSFRAELEDDEPLEALGSTWMVGDQVVTGTGTSLDYVFATAGLHSLSLWVSDSEGGSGYTSLMVMVLPAQEDEGSDDEADEEDPESLSVKVSKTIKRAQLSRGLNVTGSYNRDDKVTLKLLSGSKLLSSKSVLANQGSFSARLPKLSRSAARSIKRKRSVTLKVSAGDVRDSHTIKLKN